MRITTLSLLLLLTLAAGCAMPRLPFVSSASEAVGLNRIFENDQQQLAKNHQKRSLVMPHSASNKKPFWKRMLAGPEPRVVRTNDPVRLNSRTPAVSADVHIEAARLHEQRGDVASAVRAYQQALKIDANNEVALLSFARLYDRTSAFGEAQKLYDRAIAKHPGSARARNDYGLCLVRKGELTTGMQQLSRAVELAPEEPRYRNNIAQVLVSSGRVDDALAHLRMVHPEPVAQYNVGHWLQGHGDSAAALPHFVRASQLDPQLEAAHAMVAHLQANVPSVPQTAAAPNPAPY